MSGSGPREGPGLRRSRRGLLHAVAAERTLAAEAAAGTAHAEPTGQTALIGLAAGDR